MVSWRSLSQAHIFTTLSAHRRAGKLFLICKLGYQSNSVTTRLIAIMLGRLNLGVNTCINEYRTLGERVFGKPRKAHVHNRLWAGSKYDYRFLENTVKEVVERYKRDDDVDDLDGGPWQMFKQEPPRDGSHFCKRYANSLPPDVKTD